ncbi:hypothetical protein AYO44_04985 [Planctomycetaceae bacterium SCGC AG-212-F19]|nr:hypothetical protein AYO44_04985 [Planctomycetaceae bacterium SCGC AG-212-F19]
MKLPEVHTWGLNEGIQLEPTIDVDRVALWVPRDLDCATARWQRISSAPRATVTEHGGICSVPATAIHAQQRQHGFFGKLWPGRRESDGATTWTLPSGETVDQVGARQADCLLAWSADEKQPLEESVLRERWPDATEFLHLGGNLVVVVGNPGQPAAKDVASGNAAAQPHDVIELAPHDGGGGEAQVSPLAPGYEDELSTLAQLRAPAEERLRAAREPGDKRALATALTDLGTVLLRQRDAATALGLFQEALLLVRELGDTESDVLGNLGLALLRTSKSQEALHVFEHELALAQRLADRFATKLALEHVARAKMVRGYSAEAMVCVGQALALARELGDVRHEYELLWFAGILHAELGQRDQAITSAETAVGVMEQMGKPEAAWFADHVQRFRRETAAESPASEGRDPQLPDCFVASMWEPPPTPEPRLEATTRGAGVLRMALSAGKAMAQFVGSGFQTVPPATRQQRLQVCSSCEHHTGLRCRLCGCFTGFKSRFPYERCPIGKWPT